MRTRSFSPRRTWERVRTVPGLGRNVAILTVLLGLGLGAFAVIVGNQGFTYPWEDRDVITADFAEAPAVEASQHPKVRIAGVEVGQVTKSEATSNGQARLTLSLEPGHVVYDNAKVVLRPKNPLNEMFVDISPGGPPGKPLAPGANIPVGQTSRPIQADQVLDHLDDRSRAALSDLLSMSSVALANAPQNLPGGLNATDATVVKFQPVLAALQTRQENIRNLVTALSQIASSVGGNDTRLARLADSMQQALDTISQHSGDVSNALAQLPGTSDQLRNAMGGVTQLTGQLNPALDGLNRASDKLPATLRNLSTTVDSLGRTVQAAGPVVAAARPVVSDLKPLVSNVNGALGDLLPISGDLKSDTATMVPYLNDLAGFVFNTSSIFSVSDAQGGMIRGHLAVPLPDGGVLPGTHGGNDGKNLGGSN